ncbi:uncharacterized protein [Clytia hemisphaerica]|uniref:uncharacterized protein n=1 Tax=Clytia hemisphaerica TaxID=252671 RepID=UPI0034D5EED9
MIVMEVKCGATNNITALSTFTACSSAFVAITLIPLNLFIILSLMQEKKLKTLFFYKLVLTLAFADSLTGLLACPSSISNHLKESLDIPLSNLEIYLQHTTLLFTDAVALITLTFLSFDRLFCIIYPVKYFNGLSQRFHTFILILPWPLAAALVAPTYMIFKFIKQLVFFTAINISFAMMSLVGTMFATRYSLYHRSNVHVSSDCNCNIKLPRGKESIATLNKAQTTITTTFLRMIVVFIISYVPMAITVVYMNVCEDCDCTLIHIMRDVSIISLLSSSALRPITFILNLKVLKRKFSKKFCHFFVFRRRPRSRTKTLEIFVIEPTKT